LRWPARLRECNGPARRAGQRKGVTASQPDAVR
jgi:hypothetical protein